MTRESAIKQLEECKAMDPEVGHETADIILCELLTALGYRDVVEAYDAINPKWYA